MSTHSDSFHQRQAIAASAAIRKISMGCRSMPSSPRLMPKSAHFYRPPPAPPSPSHTNGQTSSKQHNSENHSVSNHTSWHFSALTDHLNVQQVNNYNSQSGFPEINWQERCLELQLELHRSKNQSERIRNMLRDKVNYSFHILTLLFFRNDELQVLVKLCQIDFDYISRNRKWVLVCVGCDFMQNITFFGLPNDFIFFYICFFGDKP